MKNQSINNNNNNNNKSDQQICFSQAKYWNNQQVLHWIQQQPTSNDILHKYESYFKEHEIMGEDLITMTREMLNYMNIKIVGHQNIILKTIENQFLSQPQSDARTSLGKNTHKKQGKSF